MTAGRPYGQRQHHPPEGTHRPAELALYRLAIVILVFGPLGGSCPPPRVDALDDEESLIRPDEPEPPGLAHERGAMPSSRSRRRSFVRSADSRRTSAARSWNASCARTYALTGR